MLIFKCKMCGGDLELIDGKSIAECQHCGTVQTLPAADNEKKIQLFNRANKLRMSCEFDRAASVYENIIAEYPEDAEGYWGLCLCNYGIEYVDDPATGEKKPTCHRASFGKLQDDDNFIAAIDYADPPARKQYRSEAREIDRITEEILSISKNEKPYDIFICYKEQDENKERTVDSLIAENIYDMLTDKGYKVFFARITLEDKIGMLYEPYIFAALNSAKVMLCIGTCEEYFEAVWVKNEWSRFLKLSAKDKSKILIPCYKEMDPYELPSEFRALQAQDLGKIGADKDLLRGIEKILGKKQEEAPVQKQVVVNTATGATTETFLTRAKLSLEAGDFASANKFCESALNMDPENADAYLFKLLSDMHLKSVDDLSVGLEEFTDNINYQRALRFGNAKRKEWLRFCADSVVYNIATKTMINAGSSKDYAKAAEVFARIPAFNDAKKKREKCIQLKEKSSIDEEYKSKKELYDQAYQIMVSAKSADDFNKAANIFKKVSGFLDADEQKEKCQQFKEYSEAEAEEIRKEKIYQDAIKKKNKSGQAKDLISAIEKFEKIIDYKDSKKQMSEIITLCIELCQKKMRAIIASQNAENRKAVFKFLSIASIIITALVFVPWCGSNFSHPLLFYGFMISFIAFVLFLIVFIISRIRLKKRESGDYNYFYEKAFKLTETELGQRYKKSVLKYKTKNISSKRNNSILSVVIVVCILVSSVIMSFMSTNVFYGIAMNNNNYQGAYDVIRYTPGESFVEKTKEALIELQFSNLKTIKVEDVVGFGYFQDAEAIIGNDLDPIEWLVLDVVDGKALLLQNNYIEYPVTEFSGSSWQDSNIREYLNDDFIDAYFADEQKEIILLSETETRTGDTDSYHKTEDRVFLLSDDEVEQYFYWKNDRKFLDRRLYEWYLRSPGELNSSGSFNCSSVSGYGDIKYNDISEDVVIRAAMWIDISNID